MTTPPIEWQWGEVDARNDAGDLCLTHRRDGARLWVRGGRLVRGDGYATARPAARRDLARVGAIVRLRQQGRYLVHASGVVDPQGRAWLLSGDSGSGKSTLAYALARRGWRVLGDDGVVIEAVGTVICARAWRDPLLVSDSLSDVFPELAARDGRPGPDPADPRRRAPMPATPADRAPVAAIIFVGRAEARSIERIGPVEALASLVRQSPWVILADRHAVAHLAALRRMASLPAFRLGHTPAELLGIEELLAGVLA